jgi:hypothetical protein
LERIEGGAHKADFDHAIEGRIVESKCPTSIFKKRRVEFALFAIQAV